MILKLSYDMLNGNGHLVLFDIDHCGWRGTKSWAYDGIYVYMLACIDALLSEWFLGDKDRIFLVIIVCCDVEIYLVASRMWLLVWA